MPFSPAESVVRRFRQLEYYDAETGLSLQYNLFVPDNAPERLPLVLFMGDASTVGPDATIPLRQCLGARVWTEPELQAAHPCIVLVPQFPNVVVNDAWETAPEVPVVLKLLDEVARQTHADRNHLFTTGQSMGGMLSLYFNAIRPNLFAASLFVACQWNPEVLAPLVRKRFCYIVAAGDCKASQGMEQIRQRLMRPDAGGCDHMLCTFSARNPLDWQENHLRKTLFHRLSSRRIFLTFEKGSVLPPDGNGHEHMCSFDCAYRLRPLCEWLVAPPVRRR